MIVDNDLRMAIGRVLTETLSKPVLLRVGLAACGSNMVFHALIRGGLGAGSVF